MAAVITLSSFLLIEPYSCGSVPSLTSGGFLGLEELPFAGAERAADSDHLAQIDARLKRLGDEAGAFPTSNESLEAAVRTLAYEQSPYERDGKKLPFELRLVLNQGTPYSTTPERPGIVYYAVDLDGRQFVLTISGLNAPYASRPSMMRAEAFVGGKQPWGGLLATQESLYPR
jgi:hypothetical protein